MSRFSISLVLVSMGLALFGDQVNADGGFVVARGHVVCLDSLDRPVDSLFSCGNGAARFGLTSRDGKLYKFSPGDAMISVFSDSRVRERELQITGTLHAPNTLEIIKLQSVKDGKLFDIYYFCELCNIKAYTPGLCPCCRNELEFRETPQQNP